MDQGVIRSLKCHYRKQLILRISECYDENKDCDISLLDAVVLLEKSSRLIFEKLKKETPELLGKVCVISGDASLLNLGMCEDHTHLLLEEVSIVFHCAAVVNFKKPLEIILKNNVLSLSSVIELCRKMRKFEVLVYTSTAFSNANHLNFPLKEEVYRLPFHARQFIDALK
ncbi:hypothetical protein AVEN_118414-1 [Araneus ventricosus]|uniref:Fatty acyl-CoA reductase n=1 Tax=Araneus ventricosus TaxID=182803 RepID=A0A4Y2B554_ARAVE|nr:hypothetical protein AVEN_118414-1 [Araneus ventricosus]